MIQISHATALEHRRVTLVTST